MTWRNRIIGYGKSDPRKLVPHPKNWRKHPDRQAKAVAATLGSIGWVQDIIINRRTGRMLDGHLRIELAILQKEKTVPVKYVDLSEEEEETVLATLDPITGMAEADKERLSGLLAGMRIESPDMKELVERIRGDFKIKGKVTEDEYEPPAEIKTKIKRGDIFQLGRHRVMCGDATNIDELLKLMAGKKAIITFTSPPYNVGYLGQKNNPRTHRKYLSDEDTRSLDEYSEFLKQSLQNFLKISEEVFINIGIVEGNKIAILKWLFEFRDEFKDIIYWIKTSTSPHIQKGVINNRTELIIGFGDGQRKFKNAQFHQGTYWNIIEGKPAGNWGNEIKNAYSNVHKATFPLYLADNIIKNFSPMDGVVSDPFLGTGTSLLACEQLGRICYGMEISPQYCEIICQRWEKFTGQLREKVA